MIEPLIAVLGEELKFTAQEIAEVLWLTLERHKRLALESPEEDARPSPEEEGDTQPPPKIDLLSENETIVDNCDIQTETETVGIYTHPETKTETDSREGYIPLSVPNAPALSQPLELIRALKPLLKKFPSSTEAKVDEEATVDWIAQTDVWMPIVQPVSEPWLELALVVDESASMILWRQTIEELQKLFKHYGIFRDVQVWGIGLNKQDEVYLRAGTRSAQPKELVDLQGRRLILLVSDCVDPLWERGRIWPWLHDWTRTNPVALLQMLPRWLWSQTALGQGIAANLRGLTAGTLNCNLQVKASSFWQPQEIQAGVKMPVLNLEPERAECWSKMLAGQGDEGTAGYVLLREEERWIPQSTTEKPTARQRVSDFTLEASPEAQRLAGLLAAAPVITMPVVRLIQQSFWDNSTQVQVAEVFLGGLLSSVGEITPETDSETVRYEFREGVRRELLKSVPVPDARKVLDAVSDYVVRGLGKTLQEFIAWLLDPSLADYEESKAIVKPFAIVAREILEQLGYEFAPATPSKRSSEVQSPKLEPEPALQTFSFEVATLVVVETRVFTFEVATLERRRGVFGLGGNRWVVNKRQKSATGIIEVLEEDVRLELMEIPGGIFWMGSPEDELERYTNESPQHKVTVPPFYLGRYPVTQAQWRVVAGWEKVERALNPDPSYFKEPYEEYDRWSRPVERVSWYDAVEFCARLSRETGWEYRLPSEAEWEYACRALISESSENRAYPPFHFGETISTEVANYDGTYTYGRGVKGEDRGQTTPVGYFQVANGFGLYDLHGNVWEWCADHWHENYEGAPKHGSIWLSSDINKYVLRGGSWVIIPWLCRSACRVRYDPDDRGNYIGFRVARSAPRTL